jgi:hypothetical protein
MDDIEAKFHALHAWIDREEAHSRHVLGNTKMVTTFSATLAATFLATAVADGNHGGWDLAAGVALAAAVLITLVLIAKKRKASVDRGTIESGDVPVVRGKAMQAAQDNKEQAEHAHNLMTLQVGLCLLSCIFAAAPSLIEHVR